MVQKNRSEVISYNSYSDVFRTFDHHMLLQSCAYANEDVSNNLYHTSSATSEDYICFFIGRNMIHNLKCSRINYRTATNRLSGDIPCVIACRTRRARESISVDGSSRTWKRRDINYCARYHKPLKD